jgi:thiol-disulfide isomerase/thioredoxin
MSPRIEGTLLRNLVAVLVCLAAVGVAHATNLALAPDDPAPMLRARGTDGGMVRVDFGAQRLTLVNFWATWCEPCRREMPKLQALHERHGAEGLRVVGVARERTAPGQVAIHAAQIGVNYEILVGGRETGRLWGGIGILPTTFLIDQEGKVLRRYVGGSEEAVSILVDDVERFFAGEELNLPYVRPANDTEAVEVAQ